MTKEKNTITILLAKLEKIQTWFDEQKELDIDTALKQAEQGMEIIKELKNELRERENAFKEISEKSEK